MSILDCFNNVVLPNITVRKISIEERAEMDVAELTSIIKHSPIMIVRIHREEKKTLEQILQELVGPKICVNNYDVNKIWHRHHS